MAAIPDTRTRMETRLLWTLAFAVVVYRIWNLPAYPLHEDETATIESMKAIVRTGLPWTSTGQLYWRGLFAHYVMAMPLLFMEVSEYSVRLVPAVASGAVILLAHRMCSRLGDSIAAWIAVAFLAASSLQDYLASFARHYQLFQLAFCATTYLAARYFIDHSNRAGRWLVVAAIATIGTHQLSLEIGIVCALGLVIGGRYELLKKPTFWAGVAAVFVASSIAIGIPALLKPSWVFANRLATPLPFAGMAQKDALYLALGSFLPLGLSFAAAGVIPAMSRERRAWRLYLSSFVACMLLVSFTAPVAGLRYIGNLFPLGVVSAALTISWLYGSARHLGSSREGRQAPRRSHYGLPLAALLIFSIHLALTGNWNFEKAFGRQLQARNQRPHHEFILQRLQDDDLVISLDPGLTKAYLGRAADFFLREKVVRRGRLKGFEVFSEFEKTASSIPVLDNPRALDAVIKGHPGRVWVYVNYKIGLVSPKGQIVLRDLRPVFANGIGLVLFRNRMTPLPPRKGRSEKDLP